jgi:hypothetical protein
MSENREFTEPSSSKRSLPRPPFHIEKVVDPFTRRDVIGMVRHASYYRPLGDTNIDDSNNEYWQRIGFEYLDDLTKAIDQSVGQSDWLSRKIWAALKPKPNASKPPSGFGWLNIEEHTLERAPGGPLRSFWVKRTDVVQPRTLVLLAGSVDQNHNLLLRTGVGLRIAIHVYDNHAIIFGVTLSGLFTDQALELVEPRDSKHGKVHRFRDLREAIAKALNSDYVWIHALERGVGNLRIVGGFALNWRGSEKRLNCRFLDVSSGSPNEPPGRNWITNFCVDIDTEVGGEDPRFRVVHVRRNEYIGSAGSNHDSRTVRSFLLDPASQGSQDKIIKRRPTHEEKLDEFMKDLRWPPGKKVPLRGPLDNKKGVLRGPLDQKGFRGYQEDYCQYETRAASPKTPAANPKTLAGSRKSGDIGTVDVDKSSNVVLVASSETKERDSPYSDRQASIETYQRAAELFTRLEAFGISPDDYFRFARLPLVSRARPSMIWAPDGELPNAQVQPFFGDSRDDSDLHADCDPIVGYFKGNRQQLLVKYGSASPLHRHKLELVNADNRKKAQYLSVASDSRWAWHEFGHVLNYASTGELEFPFAHSAGDALAAIVTDPVSELARDLNAPIRFVTFPWIEVPGRSHGRSVYHGYCWCGRRNPVRLNSAFPIDRYRHSYFGEQLMSSSLFRLYRSLGGDTRSEKGQGDNGTSDENTRLEASDYCIYLIMRAIQLLGPNCIAPARTPDQFVSALIDADMGTGDWRVEGTWPLDRREARTMNRHGGRVHKVIRWAFEKQGLYAADGTREIAEGPGKAPKVDIFIADRRPKEPGGYEPVALRTSRDELWHANRQSVRRDGQDVIIEVGNRGSEAAKKVTLRVWFRVEEDEKPWSYVGEKDVPEVKNGKFETATIKSTTELPTGKCWILVSADASEDPSNLPPGDKADPPTAPKAVLELVAHDNNLALAWL